jgi:hypothetical protein
LTAKIHIFWEIIHIIVHLLLTLQLKHTETDHLEAEEETYYCYEEVIDNSCIDADGIGSCICTVESVSDKGNQPRVVGENL